MVCPTPYKDSTFLTEDPFPDLHGMLGAWFGQSKPYIYEYEDTGLVEQLCWKEFTGEGYCMCETFQDIPFCRHTALKFHSHDFTWGFTIIFREHGYSFPMTVIATGHRSLEKKRRMTNGKKARIQARFARRQQRRKYKRDTWINSNVCNLGMFHVFGKLGVPWVCILMIIDDYWILLVDHDVCFFWAPTIIISGISPACDATRWHRWMARGCWPFQICCIYSSLL